MLTTVTAPTVVTSADNSHEVLPASVAVPRNEASWAFDKEKLKRKGLESGDRFALVPAYPKTEEEKVNYLKWIGADQLINLSYARLRGMATNWTESAASYESAADDAPMTSFNEAEFVNIAGTFSARGESIGDLNDEKDKLTQDIIVLGANTGMDLTEKVAQFSAITSRIKEITEAIETRRRAPRAKKSDAAAVAA